MIQRPSVSKVHTFTGHKDSLYAWAAVSDHEWNGHSMEFAGLFASQNGC
jgi:hypothetical protein